MKDRFQAQATGISFLLTPGVGEYNAWAA
jgi:hypothetical protein